MISENKQYQTYIKIQTFCQKNIAYMTKWTGIDGKVYSYYSFFSIN